MTPLAAACLVALGLALMRPGDPRLAGIAITAVAALDLALGIAGDGRGIDPHIAATVLSLVSATMALGLMLAAGALMLSRFERHDLTATLIAGIAGVIAVFVLLSHLTGISRFYSFTSIGSPALPSAVALLCIAVGIILRIGARTALRRPRPLWHLLAVLGSAIAAASVRRLRQRSSGRRGHRSGPRGDDGRGADSVGGPRPRDHRRGRDA